MIRFTLTAFATVGLLLMVGCTKEDPSPELRDPIYQDLQKRAADAQKSVDESKAKILELSDSLEKAEPNSIDKRDIERDLAKAKRQELDSRQWALYYTIRGKRRRIVDHMTYREALHAGKEWPDPHEYSDYLVNRRLVEANRNWSARVPRLQDRLPSSAKKAPAPKAE